MFLIKGRDIAQYTPSEDSAKLAHQQRLIRVVARRSIGTCTQSLINMNSKDSGQNESMYRLAWGAQWFSGRVLDSRPRGRGFEPHRRHCVLSLS